MPRPTFSLPSSRPSYARNVASLPSLRGRTITVTGSTRSRSARNRVLIYFRPAISGRRGDSQFKFYFHYRTDSIPALPPSSLATYIPFRLPELRHAGSRLARQTGFRFDYRAIVRPLRSSLERIKKGGERKFAPPFCFPRREIPRGNRSYAYANRKTDLTEKLCA